MKYERPDLEEIELELEGSFLVDSTGGGKDPNKPVGPGTGDGGPDSPWD